MTRRGDAEELRRHFDAGFAMAAQPRATDVVGLLGLQIANDAYALRIRQMQALVSARAIISVPGGPAAMIGLAGIRGRVVPVFSLPALMGCDERRPLRWLVTCGKEGLEMVALGFAEFDGYIEARTGDLRPLDERELHGAHVREIVGGLGATRGIVDLSSVVDAVYAGVSASQTLEG